MTYGSRNRNSCPSFRVHLDLSPTILTLLFVFSYSTDGVYQDSTEYSTNNQLSCEPSLKYQFGSLTQLIPYSNSQFVISQGEYQVKLICGAPPGQCSFLMEWSCGENPLSGFYNCSESILEKVVNGNNCFLVKPNEYNLVGNDVLDKNSSLVSSVISIGFTYELITYEIPEFNKNLSLCYSNVCLDSLQNIVPFGRYFLSDYSANCPCQDFSCCQETPLKRSINNSSNTTVYSKCSQNTTGFICPTNDTCTAYRIDTTPSVGNCSSYYPYSQYTIVCNSGGCISLTSISTDPGILPDFAFWILFGVTILIFAIAVIGGLKLLCFNRPQTM